MAKALEERISHAKLDAMIMDVAVYRENGKLRLKYLAIAGGEGPQVVMEPSLASETIKVLQYMIDHLEAEKITFTDLKA